MSWSLRGHRDGVPLFCIIVGNNPNLQSPVVRMPVSANPGLNFNPGFLIWLSKELSWIILSILFRVFNDQIVGLKRIKLNLLFKPSCPSPNFALTVGYLNPASNNPAQVVIMHA